MNAPYHERDDIVCFIHNHESPSGNPCVTDPHVNLPGIRA